MYEADLTIRGIFYFKLNGIDATNKMTKLRIIWWKDIIYITECEIKGSGNLLFVFIEKLLYEVCLIRIKKQVVEKRSTVGIHRSVDCLEKHVHQTTNMLSIKNSGILIISVSENIMVESQWFFLQYPICSFLR
jgi:hypothetical protein